MSQPKEQFKLKTVTPKALKVLQENGLLAEDTRQVAGRLLKISIAPEQLQQVCEVIFDEDFSGVDWEEFDLSKFTTGYNRFLLQFWGASSGLEKSAKN